MSLLGTRLGPYEITAKLGEGGMGEVWRATDTKLKREVAIKVLPAEFTEDEGRLARFEREAQLLAQLNHPRIASIFGLEESNGVRALVMELVEGPTLAERLEQGPLPLDESLAIARQIAEALEEAHGKGIVHRDLKPQNIKVSKSGKVKVLDFGLAKLTLPAYGAFDAAPTIAELPTASGVVLGTVGYMSPEQVRGERVDSRCDLFAFGCVLYEMLTGEVAFRRRSAIESLNAILKEEPQALATPQSTTPAAVARVVRHCLEKDPAERYQSAHDLGFDLEALTGASEQPASSAAPSGDNRRRRLAWLLAALVAGAALATLVGSWRRGAASPETPLSAPQVVALAPFTVDLGYEGEASLAPDGETVAYVADRSGDFEIYLQQVGSGGAINLTHDPADDVQPAISPDGRLIAFVSTRESRLALIYRSPGNPLIGGDVWVIPVLGGLPRKVAEDGNFPSWSPDGRTIFFVRGISFRPEIRRVPATGGESSLVPIELPEGFKPAYLFDPRVSPDGRWLLFSATESFFVAPVEGGKAVAVGVGRHAIWDPSGGAILYCSAESGRNSSLWRLPFSPARGAASGTALPVIVGPAALERPALASSGRQLLVTAVERTANLEALPLDAEAGTAGVAPRALTSGHNDISFASPSPDFRSHVYEDRRGSAAHLWRVDEGSDPIQLTEDAAFAESYPRWSPDGRTIAFNRRPANSHRDSSNAELWVMAPDGGASRRLTQDAGHMAWLPDSQRLVYKHLNEFRVIAVEGGGFTKVAFDDLAAESIFAVSPDGEWLVYQRNSLGDVDLGLVRLAGGPARQLLRTERQDHHPSFSPSGRWLYFQPDHLNLWRIPGPAQGWREALPEQVTRFPESGLFLEDPQLSADGRQLVYTRIRTVADLWVVELTDPRGPGEPPGAASALAVR